MKATGTVEDAIRRGTALGKAAFNSGKALYARNSMNFSPCSNRFTASGQSGSSQANSALFEQFPFRIQMNETGWLLNSQWSTKSSSLLMMIACSFRARSQILLLTRIFWR